MKTPSHPLLHQLAWAIVIKLLLLTAIWWFFLADQKSRWMPSRPPVIC